MKKILPIIIALAFTLPLSSFAQEKGLIRGGLGLALGTKSALNDSGDSKMGVGITIGGDYFITDKITISPAYTYFFKSSIGDTGFELSVQASALDFDGKYYFVADKVNVYGLFGLTIGFAKASSTIDFGTGPETITAKDSEFGINIGGGIDFYLSDSMFLNGQLKYNTPLEQLVINLGVGFNF